MKTNEQLMKACQVGCNNLNDANNLLAECYGRIGRLTEENERLRKDAERYQWLREQKPVAWFMIDKKGVMVVTTNPYTASYRWARYSVYELYAARGAK